MSRARVIGIATSLKTTVALFCLLAALLFLNVALPQERVVGEERFLEITGGGGAAHFFLVDLGLGRISVSPLFLGFLGLFFVNLTAVLIKRTGVTIRRTRLRPPSLETLRAWTEGDRALRGIAPEEIERSHVLGVLKGFGYRAVNVGTSAVWSVKHRTAPLGFLLFHLSFFLICAGGAAIYYTRFVGTARVVEGREFTGFTNVVREAPLAGTPALAFSVHEVAMEFEKGQPVHLSAVLRFRGPRGGPATTQINHPARSGSSTVIVNRAGLAPLLWLQDLRGFTLDRLVVAASTLSGASTVVPLADGLWSVELRPLVDRSTFPSRDELSSTEFEVLVRRKGDLVFEGTLRPGQEAVLEDAVLVLEDLSYWAGLYVVSERGGGLLIAGFILGIIGLVWRLMLYRREVAVVWEDATFSVSGRAEIFSHRFREELDAISSYVQRGDQG
jgi:hypothetical protein